MKKLYRFERDTYSVIDDEGFVLDDPKPKVDLKEFNIVRETTHCYYIKISWNKEKRILKTAQSTYAYDTKEKAWSNYRARCRRNLSISRYNLKLAKIFHEHAQEVSIKDINNKNVN